MMQSNRQGPLKRHPVLQPLSRAHHQLLMGCLLMEKGLRQSIAAQRISAFAQWFLAGTVIPHLTTELAWLEQLDAQDDMVLVQNLSQEKALLKSLGARANNPEPEWMIDELRRHVRWQERDFFSYLQQYHGGRLVLTTRLHHNEVSCTAGWPDAFWVTAAP